MSYEKRYMETLQKICYEYDYHTTSSSWIDKENEIEGESVQNTHYCTKNIKKEIEMLRSTFNSNEQTYTIVDSSCSFYIMKWVKINISDFQVTTRELAEIICPLGFAICNDYGTFYITKLKKNDRIWLYFSVPKSHARSILYIFENNLPTLSQRVEPWYEVESVAFSKTQFVGYLHWSARRNAMLVAYKYKKGAFFHTLKWIALFF